MRKASRNRALWIGGMVALAAVAVGTIAVVAKAKSTSTVSSTTNNALSASQFSFGDGTQVTQLVPGTTYRLAFQASDLSAKNFDPTNDADMLNALDSITPCGVNGSDNSGGAANEITVSTIQRGNGLVVYTFTTTTACALGGPGNLFVIPYGMG